MNEFPYMCGIVDMNTKIVICGCTIIDPKYVLTSAHCVINRTLSDLGCLVGGQDYSLSDSPYKSTYRFLAFIPYPSFDPISNLNDIAIMKVNGQIQFNVAVSAVCLPLRYLLTYHNFDQSPFTSLKTKVIHFNYLLLVRNIIKITLLMHKLKQLVGEKYHLAAHCLQL